MVQQNIPGAIEHAVPQRQLLPQQRARPLANHPQGLRTGKVDRDSQLLLIGPAQLAQVLHAPGKGRRSNQKKINIIARPLVALVAGHGSVIPSVAAAQYHRNQVFAENSLHFFREPAQLLPEPAVELQ